MLSLRKKQTRVGWLFLTAGLLVLYFCQIVPHDHRGSGHADQHSEHHDVPIAHAHHSHSDDHDTNDETDRPEPAHHHDLAQHIDSHFIRAVSLERNIHPESALQVAQIHMVSDEEPAMERWNDLDIWIPETIPIFPLDSRAPPLHG
jgi:hypothetical protein